MKFKREIVFSPAFDKRNPDPTKNYGICAITIAFNLSSSRGTLVLRLLTNQGLPETVKEYNEKGGIFTWKYQAWGLGSLDMHSFKPHFVGHQKSSRKCDFIGKKYCYVDGSCLAAEKMADILLREGTEGLWNAMEKRYKSWSAL